MKLLRRIQYLMQRRKADAELTEEIEHHRQIRGDGGAMGNMDQAFKDSRDVWAWPWLDRMRSYPRPRRVVGSLVRRLRWTPSRRSAETQSIFTWLSIGVFVAIQLGWGFLTQTPLTARTRLVLAGFYLTVSIIEGIRRVERESELKDQASQAERVFVDDSEAVLDLAKLTGYEAVKQFTPYLGKWMTITGVFEGLAETLQRDAIHLSVVLADGRRINLRFPLDCRERLSRLREGQRITAIGQIRHTYFTLTPEHCELLRAEALGPMRRLTLAS